MTEDATRPPVEAGGRARKGAEPFVTSIPQTAGDLLQSAADYAARGWSVVPLRAKDKRPAVPSWERLQQKRAGVERVKRHWESHPTLNVGVVTGAISGLVVVDVDGPEGEASTKDLHLPITPVVETGKGRHFYFQHPGTPVKNAVRLLPGVDLRADGGYVVAPPSVHPSGTVYEWSVSPDDVDLSPCPAWVMEKAGRAERRRATPPEEWRRIVGEGASEGERNTSAARLAGHLLRRGVDPFVTLDLLRAWNVMRCAPPLPEVEVGRIVDSIAGRELQRVGGERRG